MSEHPTLELIAEWSSTDVEWVAHVITKDKPCGCRIDVEYGHDFCPEWTEWRAHKKAKAERAFAEKRQATLLEAMKAQGTPPGLLP